MKRYVEESCEVLKYRARKIVENSTLIIIYIPVKSEKILMN